MSIGDRAGNTPSPVSPAELLGVLIVALTLTLAFTQARQRALDPIIDTGRDLYVATQLAAGERLYGNFVYNYPPLVPYLLSGVVATFGASLLVFEITGAVIGFLTIAASYWIARNLGGPLSAFLVSLMIAALSFAGASTWGANYLFPYSYSATMGMLFLLFFFGALLRFIFNGRAPMSFAIMLLCGLAASWSKLEYFVVVAVAFAVATFVHRFSLRSIATAAAALAGSLFLWCTLLGKHPFDVTWIEENLLRSSLLEGTSASFFYGQVSGTANWPATLLGAAAGAALTVLFVGFLHLLARSTGSSVPTRVFPIILILLGISTVTLLLSSSNLFFRGWTILQLAALVFAPVRDRRSPLFLLAVFSIASTLRVALNVTPQWYGFVLIVPVEILAAYVLCRELPRRGVYPARFALLFLPLVLLLSFNGLREQRERFEMKRYPLQTDRGLLYDVNPARALALQEMLAEVRRLGRPMMVVMPEGLSLNYFSATRTPLRHYLFTPPESGDPQMERALITEIEKARPPLIAVVHRDVSEFGSRGFGLDYNQELLSYTRRHYTLVRGWTDERFQCVLLRRR